MSVRGHAEWCPHKDERRDPQPDYCSTCAQNLETGDWPYLKVEAGDGGGLILSLTGTGLLRPGEYDLVRRVLSPTAHETAHDPRQTRP